MLKRLSLLMLLAVIPACGSDSSPNATNPDAPRIALVMKSLANEFFKTMEDSAIAYHAENAESFTLIANGIKNEEDVSGQIALVEQMIAQQIDAIVIASANSQALVPILKRASDAGIVVVNIDNKLDTDTLAQEGVQIPFIGPDNRAGAKLAGEHLAKSLTAGDQVAIIGGIPSAFNAIQRGKGFEDAMSAANIEVVAQQAGNWEMCRVRGARCRKTGHHPNRRLRQHQRGPGTHS